MLKSMTGYGRAVEVFGTKKITAEIKSLNSKQIDINMKIPANYREYELEYRSFLAKEIVRGKVEVIVTIEGEVANNKILLNANVISDYYNQIKIVAQETAIPLPAQDDWFKILLSLPEVFIGEQYVNANNDYKDLMEVLNKSLEEFQCFRKNEGMELECFFKQRIEKLYNLLHEIGLYEKERIQKIREHIDDELKQIKTKVEIDQNRFEQEMIFYLEKLDVSEEKSRLKCHLDYFMQTIMEEENQGKKLSFISQEIGREINTLGSKANHYQMQKVVVMMKDELEQIKEQILNVL